MTFSAQLLRSARALSLSLAALTCSLALLAPPASAQEQATPGPTLQDLQEPEGPIVREVVLNGLESYDREGVLRTLGLVIGEPYRQMRRGVQRIWQVYRIIATDPPTIENLPGQNGIRVTLNLKELPLDLEPRFVGNDKIKTEKLREWALLYDRKHIYLHEADRIRNRMIQGYKRKGFHWIEIDNVIGGADAAAGGAVNDVIFEIREGPKVRVTGITVRGNENLPNTGWGFWRGGLSSLAKVETKGRGIIRWWGKLFDQEVLEADLVAMRDVYRGRGWLDAVVQIEDLEFNEAGNQVKVRIIVDEGPLWHVRSVDIVGIENLNQDGSGGDPADLYYDKQDLLEMFELTEGVPYERARVMEDARQLRTYYGERGYLEQRYFTDSKSDGLVFLEPDLVYDWERKEVAVTYRLVQGRQRRVREVRIVGNTHTNDKVIRRELNLLPGDLANMKEIQRALARVTRTGYFSDQQDVAHRPPQVTFREVDGDPDLIDVEYLVEEGRVVDFNLSGGIASDSGIVGIFTLNARNFSATDVPNSISSTFGEIYRKEAFHGNGETLGLELSPGSQISFWRVYYAHPDLFGSHFNRFGGAVEFKSRDRIYQSHDENRTSGQFLFSRFFRQGDFSLSLGPRWQEVDISDIDQNSKPPITLVESEGKSTFQGILVNLRYNALDNRLMPRDGVFASWNNTFYGGPFGGDNDLWKSEVLADYYFLLGDPEKSVRSGFYVGGGLGVAVPFGEPELVNYAERYFLGGATSLRGFDFRGVGPFLNADYAQGGETYARASLEYRIPVYSTPVPGTSRRQEMFRVSLFTDWGVLGLEPFELRPEELRGSVGVGFGLIRPIPLVFNFGFAVRSQERDELEVFSFRIDFR